MQGQDLKNLERSRFQPNLAYMIGGLIPALPWLFLAFSFARQALSWPREYTGPPEPGDPRGYYLPPPDEYFKWAWLIIGAMIASVLLYLAVLLLISALKPERPEYETFRRLDRFSLVSLTILFLQLLNLALAGAFLWLYAD